MLPPKLYAARVVALHRWPYLAAAFTAVLFIEREDVPTFAIDPYYRMYVNPQRCEEWTVKEIAAVLYHEINHVLRTHARRGHEREQERWAIAADMAINDDIVDENLTLPGTPITPGLYQLPLYQLEEVYYEQLEGQTRRKGIGGVGGGQCGSGATGRPEPWDVGPPTAETPGLSPMQCHLVARQVAEAVKTAGHVSYTWRRWAEDMSAPIIDWRRILAGTVRRAIAQQRGMIDYTYRRPSRRQSACPTIVLPSFYAPVPSIALIIDTSGSMANRELAIATAQVDAVVKSCGCSMVTVFDVDAAVQSKQVVSRSKQVRLTGGGGTDMGKGITAAMQMKPRPDIVIILTDGYTLWPKEKPPFAVVVGLVGNDVADNHPWWAKQVRIS